jgi:hypothetical protein
MHCHATEVVFSEVLLEVGAGGGASAFILMSISAICELGAIFSIADALKYRFISSDEFIFA